MSPPEPRLSRGPTTYEGAVERDDLGTALNSLADQVTDVLNALENDDDAGPLETQLFELMEQTIWPLLQAYNNQVIKRQNAAPPNPNDPPIIERTATLSISPDTAGLWDSLAGVLGLDFDQTATVLMMYGAYLLAGASLGLFPGISLDTLTPDDLKAVYIPWLRTLAATKREEPHGEEERLARDQ